MLIFIFIDSITLVPGTNWAKILYPDPIPIQCIWIHNTEKIEGTTTESLLCHNEHCEILTNREKRLLRASIKADAVRKIVPLVPSHTATWPDSDSICTLLHAIVRTSEAPSPSIPVLRIRIRICGFV